MNVVTAVVLYLLLFRLAIVAAGIVSIVVGYRLFLHEYNPHEPKHPQSNVESSFAGFKLGIKNAAPGTLFALFGAALISVMLIQSSPSATLESVRQIQATAGQAPNAVTETDKIQLRGSAEAASSIGGLTNMGRELEAHGKAVEAERAYQQAVTTMAEPMNDLAWIYLNSGRTKQAVNLATLAVQLRPDEPRFIDTLSKAEKAAK